MNRPARHLLTLLILLFGTLLLALSWLLATESGLQFIWRTLAAQAGPELAATQVTGSLAGRLQIQTLSYETAGTADRDPAVQSNKRRCSALCAA